MRIAVTGANGFIGRALCARLVRAGHVVTPLVRRGSGIADEVVVTSLLDEVLVKVLADCDAVVHLAGVSGSSDRDDPAAHRALWETNVDGTRAVAEFTVRAGVGRLIFVSSAKVYGEASLGSSWIPEEAVPQPVGVYAQSKLAAEVEIGRVCCSAGLEVVVVRPTVVYGPGVGGNVNSLVKLAKAGIPLPIGAVKNGRSLVALESLVDFLVLCSDRSRSPAAANQCFVVSDGNEVSTPALMRLIALSYGVKCLTFPVPVSILRLMARLLGKVSMAERVLGSFRVEATKAGRLLGWKPVISMEEQFRKMADHDSNS